MMTNHHLTVWQLIRLKRCALHDILAITKFSASWLEAAWG